MSDQPRSPKRRRILNSFNRPELGEEPDETIPRKRSHYHQSRDSPCDRPPPASKYAPQQEEDAVGVLPTQEQLEEHEREQNDPNHRAPSPRPKVTKFRFKSKSSRSSRRGDRDGDREKVDRHRDDADGDQRRRSRRRRHEDEDPSRPRSHRSRRHHHHHHHRRSNSPDDPPNPFAPDPLDPETAFRESLFDAMADDEGAAYWEAIYGQPIHIYPPPPHGGHDSSSGAGGHLEQMTDEQYAEYVRQKMWEKTHAGLLEAKARREKERQKQKEEDEAKRKERVKIEREMERSLARGEERKRRRRWEGYVKAWEEWSRVGEVGGIPWPDGVGDAQEVRMFFEAGLDGLEGDEKVGRLKEERVRWHPDKMLQRFGGKVDDKVMRDVTAVFQVVDGLFNELKKVGK